MKKLILVLILLPTFFSAYAGGGKKVTIVDGITAKMPKDFYKMEDREILDRIMVYKMPLAMFSSGDRLAEFGLSISDNYWAGNDVELLGEFQNAAIHNLFDRLQVLDQGVREVHKHQMYFFEILAGTSAGSAYEKKYSLIHYVIVQNRILVFNFSCFQFEREKYKDIAWEILSSLKIKGDPF